MRKSLLTLAFAGLAASVCAQEYKWQAFYTQTYEKAAKVSDVWTYPSLNTTKSTFELAQDETGNHYVNANVGNDNGRGLYNLDQLSEADYEGIDEYRIEFDLALAGGNNQATTSFSVGSPDIQTMGSDWVTPCGAGMKYPNNNLGSGSLFSMIQTSTSGLWRVYSQGALSITVDGVAQPGNPLIKDEIKVTLTENTFYHYVLTVSPATEDDGRSVNVTAQIFDSTGEAVKFTVTEIIAEGEEGEEYETEAVVLPYTDQGSGCWFKHFYCLMGRYKGGMMIDNVQVMKLVDAQAVAVPTLAMTGVNMESRIISLDNGSEAEGLTPYYAVVDEATYMSAVSAEGLEGVQYTEPFAVSSEMNYVLAWNVNEIGKASELTKYSCEAGVAIQLNAPTITASDYNGRKKTFTATCDQSNIKPIAPLTYTIYMSTDSIEWVDTTSITVESGKVYAKVEADGYAPAGCQPVEAPEGIYGSTKWTVGGMVITSETCPLFNFDNSGKGRVHVPLQYWSEDYPDYDPENAWAVLKKLGMHFFGGDKYEMFILGSGNASGFTVSGITAYNNRNSYIKFDNRNEGDIISVKYADGTGRVFTVEDPETFTIPVPMYGNAALVSIEIKGEGTIETVSVKQGEWGIVTSSRSVCDVEKAGAIFYDHKYTIYNDETHSADTLLLTPVTSLEAGKAYIYQATSDELELVTLEAEEPVYEQQPEQIERECETFVATIDDECEDMNIYTMYGTTLMKNDSYVTVPAHSGYFVNLDGEYGDIYSEALDYKLHKEYADFLERVQKAISDYETAAPEYDEEGNIIEKPELDINALWAEKYAEELDNYTVIRVLHVYDGEVVKIDTAKAEGATLVDVITTSGIVVRRAVSPADALNGLQRGIYIVNGKKLAK